MSLYVNIAGRYGNRLFQLWPAHYIADQLGLVLTQDQPRSIHNTLVVFTPPQSVVTTEDSREITFHTPADLEAIIANYRANPSDLVIYEFFNENATLAQHYRDYIKSKYQPQTRLVKQQIAIHVRLGDLTCNYHNYRQGYFDFIIAAIAKYPGWPIVIVSQENSPYNQEMVTVITQNDSSRIITVQSRDYLTDFAELASSAVIISTSSTFTWWAAFLNDDLVGYHVYIPSNMEVHDTQGMYLDLPKANWFVTRESS